MNKEEQIPGIDTIQQLQFQPPYEIPVPFKLEYKQHTLQQGWNACYVAIIPFCMACKEPLVWHHHPEGEVLFHCPKCRREWVKGDDWKEIEK